MYVYIGKSLNETHFIFPGWAEFIYLVYFIGFRHIHSSSHSCNSYCNETWLDSELVMFPLLPRWNLLVQEPQPVSQTLSHFHWTLQKFGFRWASIVWNLTTYDFLLVLDDSWASSCLKMTKRCVGPLGWLLETKPYFNFRWTLLTWQTYWH